jgi:hypothetical protein
MILSDFKKQSARHRSSRILDDSTNEEATLADSPSVVVKSVIPYK